MLNFLKQVVLVTGHYGSGKTNLAINLAVDLRQQGRQVALIDLDIVNPYFRTADFRVLAEREGIALHAPAFANSNLDLPVLASGLQAHLGGETMVIVDVGGDDAGALALGGFSAAISRHSYTMLYVINHYRYLTREPEEAVKILREIEMAARLQVTHLVNNSHLCQSTTAQEVAGSIEYAAAVAEKSGKPLAFTAVERGIAKELPRDSNLYPIDVLVKAPWQTNARETF